MVLDASSVIRKVAKRILTSEDMVVVEAKNSAEAISMASAQMPDYIIVDAGMNEGQSEDLIRQLRALDRKKDAKIICCMTQVDLAGMMRAKRAGADEFLLKPFDRKQLMSQFRTMRKAA
ncbi:response regulator [Ahrensia kielensis]|uniref:response regulator n=1 Tax=Ahrensia kielensis TaxID=76980 RepID=UPI000377116D|nr:response regulator [Ahrensia kielensis]